MGAFDQGRGGILRVQVHRGLIVPGGFVRPSLVSEHNSEVVVGICVLGLKLYHLLVVRDGFRSLSRQGQGNRKVVSRFQVTRLEVKSSPVVRAGFVISLAIGQADPQQVMGVEMIGGERDGSLELRYRLVGSTDPMQGVPQVDLNHRVIWLGS